MKKSMQEIKQNWGHLSDKEISHEIRERICEVNMLVGEAQGRDMVVNYNIINHLGYDEIVANVMQRV